MSTTASDVGTKQQGSACAICGSELRAEVARPASTYAPRGTYRIATCARCGCGQTLPRPDAAELEAFYAREYKYDAHVLIAPEKRWRARRILDVAMRPGDRRVLDVGCMYGYLLDEARARGASTVTGVELSSGPARDAQGRGHDVFNGTIEQLLAERPDARRTYDVVVAQHVLEHVPDLGSFLAAARELVAPGGRLCVCVPNYGARARRVFREAWGWYQVPVHLHHFGPRALEELLTKNDFEVEREERRGGDSLFVLLTLLQGLGRAPSSEAVEPGAVGKALVRTASAVLRPYYFVGDDELLVVARPRASAD